MEMTNHKQAVVICGSVIRERAGRKLKASPLSPLRHSAVSDVLTRLSTLAGFSRLCLTAARALLRCAPWPAHRFPPPPDRLQASARPGSVRGRAKTGGGEGERSQFRRRVRRCAASLALESNSCRCARSGRRSSSFPIPSFWPANAGIGPFLFGRVFHKHLGAELQPSRTHLVCVV
ncbi:uncharacterized protein VTP21DRAFT_1163 [Calcarisporiella thermophila]|uniref:uncharacterized protein n=1 Tax=Calcarisporiella thermophila TaxID=911321 RepID=UPI0037436024